MAKTKKKSSFMNILGTLAALIILCVILTFITPNFLKMQNMMNVLKQTAVNALIASGMLVCLITAGIDLSVGANAIASTCMMGLLKESFGITNPVILILAALTTGTLIGWCNGMMLTRLHLPHPFVSTLGMKNILCGVALLLVQAKMVSGFSPGITWLGEYSFLNVGVFPGVPVSFILVLILFVVFHVFLNYTTIGRSIYCVGGNPEAARLSGIDSKNILTLCYMISGFMCALAGIVLIGRSGIVNPASASQPYDTDAIAACIIGGASFQGGKGTIWGTLIGALIISVIRNGLTLLNVQSDIQFIVVGSVIILAVFIDVTRGRMEDKARRLAGAKVGK